MKYLIMLFGIVVSVVLILSCSKDSPTESDKDNINPVVTVISPADSLVFNAGEEVELEVNATDNKLVVRVEFLIDDEIIKTTNSSPYKHSWNTTGLSGNYIFQAKAYDSDDNVGISDPSTIIITAVEDSIPPVVTITSPLEGSVFSEGDIVIIKSSASDNTGISKVEFFINDSLRFTDNQFPYEFSCDSTGKIGANIITTKAYDYSGNSALSSAIIISIQEEADTSPPSVNLVSPVDNAEYTDGAVVLLKAEATDNVGVAKVFFWIDGIIVYEDTTYPYEYLWYTEGSAGGHSILADAYDAQNNFGISQSVNILVLQKPFIEVLHPISGSEYEMGKVLTTSWNTNITSCLDIFLLLDHEQVMQIADSIPNGFFYSWTLPEDLVVSNKYTVLVKDATNSSVYDESTPYTKIKEAYYPGAFVSVEGGTFTMGDRNSIGLANELPLHEVTLNDYMIGKYELTQLEWLKYMSEPELPYGAGDRYPIYFISRFDVLVYCNLRSISEGLVPCYSINGSSNPDDWGEIPVVLDTDIIWNAAVCDFNASGYRLPTEAEWEYAARGGKYNSNNYIYSGGNDPSTIAWTYENSNQTESVCSDVGRKDPNQLGIYDMSGNIMELCWDYSWTGYYSYCLNLGTVVNPTGEVWDPGQDEDARIVRGGDWKHDVYSARVSMRALADPAARLALVGVRLAKKP